MFVHKTFQDSSSFSNLDLRDPGVDGHAEGPYALCQQKSGRTSKTASDLH